LSLTNFCKIEVEGDGTPRTWNLILNN